jgi:hypothetical protein
LDYRGSYVKFVIDLYPDVNFDYTKFVNSMYRRGRGRGRESEVLKKKKRYLGEEGRGIYS